MPLSKKVERREKRREVTTIHWRVPLVFFLFVIHLLEVASPGIALENCRAVGTFLVSPGLLGLELW